MSREAGLCATTEYATLSSPGWVSFVVCAMRYLPAISIMPLGVTRHSEPGWACQVEPSA
jgi:hypothetical protein